MARQYRPKYGSAMNMKAPKRGEVWLAVDRNKDHNGRDEDRKFDDNVTGGTRTCIIISNNKGNTHSPNVECVFTTKQDKAKLPTHFMTYTTPVPSTVLCEEIHTVSKKDLVQYYGILTKQEVEELDECLKISIGLK